MMIAGIAVTLLAGCGSAGDGNASAALEKTVQQRNSTPLQRERALALIELRHENFEKIGDAMKVISRELRGESPNLSQVRAAAAAIARLAPRVPSWFPAGTGPGVGRTEVRAEIWHNPEDFAVKSQAFREAATAFEAAAQGFNLPSIRSAHQNLGRSCRGCHDLYREED